SPGRRLLRCFLSDHPSFSNCLSAPCRLGDGRFLAFRLGSSFCRHGSIPDAHCIWKVLVRSLPNKKVSQQPRRPSSTIDRQQASTGVTAAALGLEVFPFDMRRAQDIALAFEALKDHAEAPFHPTPMRARL